MGDDTTPSTYEAELMPAIENWFTYHAPEPHQVSAYEEIREGAKVFAEIIARRTPKYADQSAAFRKLRECVMTSNAAIACDGR